MTVHNTNLKNLVVRTFSAWTIAVLFTAAAAGAADDPVPPASVVIEPDLLNGVLDKMPVLNWEQRPEEAIAYNFLLARANEASPTELARQARRDLSFAHLWEEPSKYRGAIVHIDGRLRKLVRYDPPKLAEKEGVKDLYEAWIFGTTNYANPWCVLVTRAPEGIQLGERIDYQVSCDAYFFKRYRYAAADKVRDAPLLMGPTLALNTAAGNATTPVSDLLGWFVGFGIATVAVIVLTAWWFWRSDRGMRRQVARTRQKTLASPDFVMMGLDDSTPNSN